MFKRFTLLVMSLGLLLSSPLEARRGGRGRRGGYHGRRYRRRGRGGVGFGIGFGTGYGLGYYGGPRYRYYDYDDSNDSVRKKITVTENKDGSTTRCVTKDRVETCKTTRAKK